MKAANPPLKQGGGMKEQSVQSPGLGAQTHASPKGLGGDSINCGAVPALAALPNDNTTQSQITDMENEGQGQQRRIGA